ncbi:MAG: hypothetical protein IJF92_00235 [Bacilli bacterium]|nr:hypothetical protein [Bacilli bacterium]MBQ3307585.1 hypothetical protein [Bacilli bacterium]
MNELKRLQEAVLDNKKKHGFNTTNVEQEFCYLYGEIAEAYDAYYKQKSSLPEELADAAIFLLGISEILGIDLYEEIIKKMKVNSERVYKFNNNGKPVKE